MAQFIRLAHQWINVDLVEHIEISAGGTASLFLQSGRQVVLGLEDTREFLQKVGSNFPVK